MRPDDEVVGVEVHLSELSARVDQLTGEVTDLSAAVLVAEAPSRGTDVTQPMYDTLDSWVAEYFAPTFSRSVGGEIRWCAAWTEHAEAVTRLEALWRSWETLRLDPATGMATWLTSHLDPQLAVLLSRSGTFGQCSPDRHSAGEPLSLPECMDRNRFDVLT